MKVQTTEQSLFLYNVLFCLLYRSGEISVQQENHGLFNNWLSYTQKNSNDKVLFFIHKTMGYLQNGLKF